MSNVRLSWNTPQPSSRQRPVAVVRLASRVAEDMPWTTIANVPHPQSEVVLPDVAPGVWHYQAIVVDIDEEESDPAYASTALAYDKPSALMGFSAAIEG